MRAPHAAIAVATWHLRPASESVRWGVRFAPPFPSTDVTVFCRDSFGRSGRVQHGSGYVDPSPGGCVTPRALRLGKPHPHITTSDVLCRPAGAPARAPPRAFAFRATPVFRQEPRALTRRTRSRFDAIRLETTPPRDQGAFLRLDSRSCDRVRSAAQFDLNTRFPRTRSPDTDGAPFVTGELLRRATSRPLGSPRGSPRRREKDASRRPLQPTLDSTSTLGPFESRARDESRDRSSIAAPALSRRDGRGDGAGPPHGDPTPGEPTLDGANPTSASSLTDPLREMAGDGGVPPEGSTTLPRRCRPRTRLSKGL